MTRAKLFLFFANMAWASLFRPSVGLEMIDLAENAAAERDRLARIKALMGNAQKVRRRPGYRFVSDEE